MDTFSIRSGLYSAKVRTRGGGLNELKYGDRNLVEPYVENDPIPRYRGNVLAPWPNRIRDGRYSFEGRDFQAPVNETKRSCALHGLVLDLNWQVSESSPTSISLVTTLEESESYPSALRCLVTYQLSEEGLLWTFDATNIGDSRAPYGASIHPHLIADSAVKIDECTLTMPASSYMEIDPVRFLPIGVQSVEEGNFDFRKPVTIGDRFIDHAFLIDKGASDSRVELRAPSGLGVWMESDSKAKWIQIHTTDRELAEESRICLAVEPMTCPPDAFNSGTDVIYLEPTQSHHMTWRIGAI